MYTVPKKFFDYDGAILSFVYVVVTSVTGKLFLWIKETWLLSEQFSLCKYK